MKASYYSDSFVIDMGCLVEFLFEFGVLLSGPECVRNQWLGMARRM